MRNNDTPTGPAPDDFDAKGGFRQEGGAGEHAIVYDLGEGGAESGTPLEPKAGGENGGGVPASRGKVAAVSKAVREKLGNRGAAQDEADVLEAASRAAESLFVDAAGPMARTLWELRKGPEWEGMPERLKNKVENVYGVTLLHREIMSRGPCGILRFRNGILRTYTRSLGEVSGLSPQALAGLDENGLRTLQYPDARSREEARAAVASLGNAPAYRAFFNLTPQQQKGRTLERLRKILGETAYAKLVEEGRVETEEGPVEIERKKVKWVTQRVVGEEKGEPDGRISFAFDPEFSEEKHAPTGSIEPVGAVDPARAPSAMWRMVEHVRQELARAGCAEFSAAMAGALEAAKELDWYLSQDAHHPVAVFLPHKLSPQEALYVRQNCKNRAAELSDKAEKWAYREMALKMRRGARDDTATVQYPQHANAAYLRELGLGDITVLRRYVMAYGDLSLVAYRGKNLSYVRANTSRISEIQKVAGQAAEALERGDAEGAARAYAGLWATGDLSPAARRIEENFTVALRRAADLGKRARAAAGGAVPRELVQEAWDFAHTGVGYQGIQFTAQRPGALKVAIPGGPATEGAVRLVVTPKKEAYGIERGEELWIATADGKEHRARAAGENSWICDVPKDVAEQGVRAVLFDRDGNRVAGTEPEDFVWNFWTMGFLKGTVRLGFGYRDDGSPLDEVDDAYEAAKANQATVAIALPVMEKRRKGVMTRAYEVAAAAPFLGGWFRKAQGGSAEDPKNAALERKAAKWTFVPEKAAEDRPKK